MRLGTRLGTHLGTRLPVWSESVYAAFDAVNDFGLASISCPSGVCTLLLKLRSRINSGADWSCYATLADDAGEKRCTTIRRYIGTDQIALRVYDNSSVLDQRTSAALAAPSTSMLLVTTLDTVNDLAHHRIIIDGAQTEAWLSIAAPGTGAQIPVELHVGQREDGAQRAPVDFISAAILDGPMPSEVVCETYAAPGADPRDLDNLYEAWTATAMVDSGANSTIAGIMSRASLALTSLTTADQVSL